MNKKDEKELQLLMLRIEDTKKKEEEVKIDKEIISNKIIGIMKEEKVDSYDFEVTEDNYGSLKKLKYSVKLISPTSLIFDVDKIERRIDSDICKRFIIKEYEIKDIAGLISYLKSCGVNPKKFKEFLNVKKKVDTKKLENLSSLGEISEDDLKGCYTLKESKTYIKSVRKEME